ncbi:MAG: hypothetical protein ACREE6_13250, partial [Limisphaerales bacterium]
SSQTASIRACPMANTTKTGLLTGANNQGQANKAWLWNVQDSNNSANTVSVYGSYGINGWLYNYTSQFTWITPSDVQRFFSKYSAVQQPSQTPQFLDCIYPDLYPYQGGTPDGSGIWDVWGEAVANTAAAGSPNQGMTRSIIARHGSAPPVSSSHILLDNVRPLPGGVNVNFVDGHCEFSKLDNLWLYYWNKNIAPKSRP